MKPSFGIALVVVCSTMAGASHAADLGTAFTYQGYLEKPAGTPVTATCDFVFSLWDDPVSILPANQVATSQTVLGVLVAGGVFTVGAPDVDFGAGVFNGTARWLSIEVKCPPDAGFTPLSPRVELQPAPHALALPGLYTQQNATSPNLIGGFSGNTVTPGVIGATIGGGGVSGSSNTAGADYATVGGGAANTASGFGSTAGRGTENTPSGEGSTVGGGYRNAPSGIGSTVAGGGDNAASGDGSTVGGGFWNASSGHSSTVSGGNGNASSGNYSTVGGGWANYASGDGSTVGGGYANRPSGNYSTVSGGAQNEADGDYSFAAGRRAKVRDPVASGDADGDNGTFVWADSTNADFTSTGPNQFLIRASGGVGINTNSPTAALHVGGTAGLDGIKFPDGTLQTTAAGGGGNTLDDAYDQGGPGAGRTITADAGAVVIGGPGGLEVAATIRSGSSITIDGTSGSERMTSSASLDFHTATGRALRLENNATSPNLIGGYSGNTVTAGAVGATIGGGGMQAGPNPFPNRVTDFFGTVGGGLSNRAGDNAGTTSDRGYATVSGGLLNVASAVYSTVGGGNGNTASGTSSVVPGGSSCEAGGDYSFVAGHRAKVRTAAQVGGGDADGDQGSFVWADSTNADFTSTGPNQFLIRAAGNVGIGTNAPGAQLHVEESGGIVAILDRRTDDGTIVEFKQDGTTEGSIAVAGTTVSYNAFTGSHYGWTDGTIERGSLVIMTGENRRKHDDAGAEPIYGIAPSDTANDPRCLGSYLGVLEPAEPPSLDNPHQIMAVGNGDIWVVDTGRNIEPGQYLISSEAPGHAMIDDPERFPVGYVIARAGEPVDWSKVPESDRIDGRKHTRISVFFESFERGSSAGLGKLVEQQQRQLDALSRRLADVEAARTRSSLALLGILGIGFGAASLGRRLRTRGGNAGGR